MHVHVGQPAGHLGFGIGFEEQIQEAFDRRDRQFGIQHLLVAGGRVGTQTEAGRGLADRDPVEIRALQEQGVGVVFNFRSKTAHHAGDRHRLALRADHQHILVDVPLRAVERLEDEGSGEAVDLDLPHAAAVEGVHRLPEFHHHVVGQVGEQVDGARTAVEEPDPHIHRALFRFDPLDRDPRIPEAQVGFLHVDLERGEFVVLRRRVRRHRTERTVRQRRELARDPVVSPQVGAVGQRLVVDFKKQVVDLVDRFQVGAERDIVLDLHQAGVIGGNAEFGFRTAHTEGRITRDLGFSDLVPRNRSAHRGEGDLHARAHVRRAADAVDDLFAGVDLQKMEFSGIGVRVDRNDLRDDDAVGIDALFDHLFDFRRREGETPDQGATVKSRQIDEIADPVHRKQHIVCPPLIRSRTATARQASRR